MVELQKFWVALVIGTGLMMLGAYSLKKASPSLTTRVLIGAVLLVAGIALAYPIIDGTGEFAEHQIRLGLVIALAGLGINQAAAPIRVAFGRPA